MESTRYKKWTDDKIISAIQEVVDGLDLGVMPTFKEIQQHYKDSRLTNAISKHNGIYYYAEIMGLEVRDSDTNLGKQQEAIAASELIARGYDVRRMPQNFPYDLLVNDCVKVDVKAARLYKSPSANFYSFNLEKPYCTCDIYMLYTLNDDRSTNKTLIIPSKFVATNTQIGMGEKESKYYQYADRWDFLEQYVEFMESVS